MVNGLPRVKPSRAQSHDLRKPTHKLVVPVAMQTRQGRQQAALLAMKAFFTNDDLLSLVINDALPAAGAPPCACVHVTCAVAHALTCCRPFPAAALHAVCKQWRALADSEWVWKSKCVERFPATAGLVGVTNYKDLFARLSGHTVHAPAKPAVPPGLGEYQFLVRLTAGDEVMLETCLTGGDTGSQPKVPWMTSLEHRRVVWPVTLPDTAVKGLADAMHADSMDAAEDLEVTKLGEVLDAVAERESGEAPWCVSVATFRAADQRCEVLLAGGIREEWPPSEQGVGSQGLAFGDPYAREGNAGCSLDAFDLRQRGFEIATYSGDAWFVSDDNEYEDYCYEPRLFFQVILLPHLRSSGSIEWELALDLECDGPAAAEDGLAWDGVYLGGSVQHCIFLEGLNEKAVSCDCCDCQWAFDSHNTL
jgi:hypothetical protein